jgi:hypothetical protein
MAEQKEPRGNYDKEAKPDEPTADRPAARPPSHEDRFRALEARVIRPEWIKTVEERFAFLEQTITRLEGDLAAANARLGAVERVAGLTPHMQDQMSMKARTSSVRETHEKQVMDEAMSRKLEAEERVRMRTAQRAAMAGA